MNLDSCTKKMAIPRTLKILTLCPIRTNEENQFLALVSSPNKRPLRNATKSLELNEPAKNKILHYNNSPRSIYENSNMTPRLSGRISSFGLFFFCVKSLLGIARPCSREKFASLSIKPRSHNGILILLNLCYYNHQ